MITSPGRASTSRPSMVIFKPVVVSFAVSVKGALPVLDVDQELVAEHAEGRDIGRGYRRAQRTDRGHGGRELDRELNSRGDVVAHVHQQVEVLHAAGAVLDAVHDLLEPTAALPTRRALATGLVREEAHEAPRDAHRACRLVPDD